MSETLLRRWSRLKREAGKGQQAAARRSEADFVHIDFEALDFNSDYTQFILPETPPGVRHRALRKLWASNPVFTTSDGLLDYAQDFSDAAVNEGKPVRSAYCIGRGFATNAEAQAYAEQGETATNRQTTEGILPSRPDECHAELATDGNPAPGGQAENASTDDGLNSDDLSRPNASGFSPKPKARS